MKIIRPKIDRKRENFLVEMTEDWVYISEFLNWTKYEGIENANERRRIGLNMVREMLHDGLIVAGEIIDLPDDQKYSYDFQSWGLSPAETMKKIIRLLDELGREPKSWELVWFDLTQKGEEVAKALIEADLEEDSST